VFFHCTFRACGVIPVVFSMGSVLASCLLNATTLLIVRFSWLLVLVVTSGTSSSIYASMSSPLVTSWVLFVLSSMTAYPVCVHPTVVLLSLSSLSKRTSLSFSISLSSFSCALLSPWPFSPYSSLSLNALIWSSLRFAIPCIPVERPEGYVSISDSCLNSVQAPVRLAC